MGNKANELEAYEIVRVRRDQIHGAPYNPRKISSENAKNLKKALKEIGLLEPIIVNKRSQEKGWEDLDIGLLTLVGGHQRLSRMDEILKKPDYELTVSLVDLSPKDEARANVLLNNPALQGEWDETLLQEIKLSYPDLDFQKDLCFDNLDIQHIFAGADNFEDIESIFDPTPEQEDIIDMAEKARRVDKLKEAKKAERSLRSSQAQDDGDYQAKHDNYVLHLVFETNSAKENFCKKALISNDLKDSYIKASILFDIYDHKIKLRKLS
jgi:ParB-like chromosome segregation protein Spo0J